MTQQAACGQAITSHTAMQDCDLREAWRLAMLGARSVLPSSSFYGAAQAADDIAQDWITYITHREGMEPIDILRLAFISGKNLAINAIRDERRSLSRNSVFVSQQQQASTHRYIYTSSAILEHEEVEVLYALAEGFSVAEIATQHSTSVWRVRSALRSAAVRLQRSGDLTFHEDLSAKKMIGER